MNNCKFTRIEMSKCVNFSTTYCLSGRTALCMVWVQAVMVQIEAVIVQAQAEMHGLGPG